MEAKFPSFDIDSDITFLLYTFAYYGGIRYVYEAMISKKSDKNYFFKWCFTSKTISKRF